MTAKPKDAFLTALECAAILVALELLVAEAHSHHSDSTSGGELYGNVRVL